MKQVTIIIGLLICGLLTGFIIKPTNSNSKNAEPPCKFEGTYILQPIGPGAPFGLDMAIPLDARNERVAITHDLANYDATLGGLFPDAIRLTTGQGEGIRTGPRSFNYTIHFWSLDRNNRRVALIVSNGTKFFNQEDCNSYEVPAGTLSVYSATQDTDNDGYPDANQQPLYCLPLICKAKRITAAPTCVLSSSL